MDFRQWRIESSEWINDGRDVPSSPSPKLIPLNGIWSTLKLVHDRSLVQDQETF